MNKRQKINISVFAVFVLVLASFDYLLGVNDPSNRFDKPWHLQPSFHEDSLSQQYRDNYIILDKNALYQQWYDPSRKNIFILVDAWGVPLNEDWLDADFAHFAHVPHVFAIHQRLANRTKHAELVEFRNRLKNNIYLFGGDSSEYNRLEYIREMGFERDLFCQKCQDEKMLAMIDSLVETNDDIKVIAWTTQSSRSGNRDSLYKSLDLIANFAERHTDIQIIVQGTHRPVLCESKVRNLYKSHWVPAVVLNPKKK